MTRVIGSLALPGLVLLVAYAFVWNVSRLPTGLFDFAYYAGGLFYASALVMAWRLDRSRLFFIALVLALGFFVLVGLPAGFTKTPQQLENVQLGVAILVPWNIVLFAIVKERGIFTLRGSIRFGFILLQAGLLLWVIRSPYAKYLAHATQELFPLPILRHVPIPQLSLLAYILGALVLLFKALLRDAMLHSGMFAVLLASLLALLSHKQPQAATLYASASGVILVIALVQYLYSMAFYDELTGLPGRRALSELMSKLSTRYVIAMADIDHFKQFNDKYGHDIGDQVLGFVATKLHRVGRGGRAFRYGGEEFTLVFSARDLAEVEPVLEHLRQDVASSQFLIRGRRRPRKKPETKPILTKTPRAVAITISIGVAASSGDTHDPQAVLKRADEALYRAKRDGRNRVSR